MTSDETTDGYADEDDENPAMPFGKFKGKRLSAIPPSYLQWVLDNLHNLDPWLIQAIEASLDLRQQPRNANAADTITRERLRIILRDWFRQVSRRHHPDLGGSGEVMAALNNARDELLQLLDMV